MAARLGARTLLLTANLDTIGQMSCNPAIGGIAKGTVVREVDALGGVMGRAADRATIQFRMLNRSKGPAVWAPRAQCDRALYRRAVRLLLEAARTTRAHPGHGRAPAARGPIACAASRRRTAVVSRRAPWSSPPGRFCAGKIHLGTDTQIPAGRAGDLAVGGNGASILKHIGLTVSRFKTGTPPRIDGRTVDWSQGRAPGRRGRRLPILLLRPRRAAPAGAVLDHVGRGGGEADHPAPISRNRRCTAERSADADRATARPSRTRSSSSPRRRGTRSSSSPRGSTRTSCT